MRQSLRLRIIAVQSVVLAAGALILGVAAWQSSVIAARLAYDRLLSGGAVQIAENVFVQGGVVTLDPPVSTIATLTAFDMVFYKIVDPRGVVVAGYDDLTSGAAPAQMQAGVVLEDGRYQGQVVRVATLGRQIDDPALGGWATIVVAQTVEARHVLAWELTLKALGVIAAMSLLALAATAIAIPLALKPLTVIEHEITVRRPEDLRPIQAEPPLEVHNLVQAIDAFMRRLQARMALMQRFIADAAHQIRTPMAALDAQVEMLSLSSPSGREADTLARIRERTTELGRLTGQLLDHAMVIHRADAAKLTPVDLNALAKAVLAQAIPLSFPREVEVAFAQAAAAPVIDGDAVSLREALSNLIDNALVHGARSCLMVAVGADGPSAWIEVRDDGDGFPAEPEQLALAFRKGAQSTGSGLGLTIVAEVMRAHGGALAFGRTAQQTCVRMCFPWASVRGDSSAR